MPYIFQINIGSFHIPIIIIFTLLGIIANIVILAKETKRLNLNPYLTALIYLIYFALFNLISRGLFILSRVYLHHDYANSLKLFNFYPYQKISFGVLLALLVAVPIGVYLYDRREDLLKYFDIFFLGYTATLFVRLGDALVRYHPGKIGGEFLNNYHLGNFRHEPSLYEAISLTVLLILTWRWRKKIRRPGTISLIVLAWISLSRFITDFFRGNDLPLQLAEQGNAYNTLNYHLSIGLSLNQVVYGLLFIGSFLVLYMWHRNISANLNRTR